MKNKELKLEPATRRRLMREMETMTRARWDIEGNRNGVRGGMTSPDLAKRMDAAERCFVTVFLESRGMKPNELADEAMKLFQGAGPLYHDYHRLYLEMQKEAQEKLLKELRVSR